MKHLISGLIYAIILLTYCLIQEAPVLFMYLAWQAGFWKEHFEKSN